MHYIIPVFLLLTAVLPAQAGTLSVVSRDIWAQADYVFDGDTFRSRKGEKIRLLGINAPEVAHDAEPGQPLGEKAGMFLRQAITGRIVRLKIDSQKRDSYGRLLAHVYLRDGTWVNGRLVEQGLAYVYTFAPNFRKTGQLLKLERAARKARRGIWATGRFRILAPKEIDNHHIGQYRLVRGAVERPKKNGYGFYLGKLAISVPRAYRPFFRAPPRLRSGQMVIVRGTIRKARRGGLYLALHSPWDLEKLK